MIKMGNIKPEEALPPKISAIKGTENIAAPDTPVFAIPTKNAEKNSKANV
jgi:hypothetical protein